MLAPVDLAAGSGECVVLRGPNGSGKTTLLRILAGLVPPSTGTVRYLGRPVDERDPVVRRDLAALIGPPAAYRDLTVADHLLLVHASWGRVPGEALGQTRAALETVGILALADRFPDELSSGQQQLFHLALTLTRPSTVLLLDEPEQRLDTDRRSMLGRILRQRRESGSTLVVACHDPSLTEAIADRVVELTPA